MGASIFWSIVVPSSIFILLVLGHECWRRICPLSFISQIPRALKWERKRHRINATTGKVRKELAKVPKNSWLAQNYLHLQFSLFFLGLCSRILFVNSDRLALGLFLILTIIAALTIGFLYGGKAWCHYICPMAPVQKIYAEPRGLFNTTAHEDNQKRITQSMCRTISQNGQELGACVACQSPCMDIDAENTYWNGISNPQQQWLYYGYIGLTVGYFVYYYLYAGNWDYSLSGAWAHEGNQLANLLKPGYYLLDKPVNIPKCVAVPITLALFTFGAISMGGVLENIYKAYQHRHYQQIDPLIIRHRMFTLCTFFIFNFFFIFSGHSFIQLLPSPLPGFFPILMAVSSSLWLYRTWQRTPKYYQRESLAHRLLKQLKKLNLDSVKFLEGRSLDDLSVDEIYVLAKVLPDFSQGKHLQTYKAMLRDAIDEGYVNPANSLDNFQQMRQELGISDKEHDKILTEIGQQYPQLFDTRKLRNIENSLRLDSYRDTLLETLLDAREIDAYIGQDRTWDTHLMQVFSGKTSSEVLEDLLQSLSPKYRNLVQELRQEYGITTDEEVDSLKRTDPYRLWKGMIEGIGLLGYISTGGEEMLRTIFQEIDADGSQYISLHELQTYIRAIDPRITNVQIEDMLTVADTNGDNLISYEEFQEVFKSCKF